MIAGVETINAKFARADWTPIVLLRESIDAAGLAGIYRAGDLCLVSSLQDGMNLVAKEFIACNVDEQGVLVLSRLTGAADEIDDAILINPFNVDGVVEGLRRAIAMPLPERRARMQRMRRQLRRATIFDWLEAILARVADLADHVGPPNASRPSRSIGERTTRPSSPPDVSVA